MHGTVRRLLIAALLTLCVGVQLVEMSGRWDRTFQDANDEAGLVAVVLCIGIAICAAGAVLSAIRLSRTPFAVAIVSTPTGVRFRELPSALFGGVGSPPLPLRI